MRRAAAILLAAAGLLAGRAGTAEAVALLHTYRPDPGAEARTAAALERLAGGNPAERRRAAEELERPPLPDAALLRAAAASDDPELSLEAERILAAVGERAAADFRRAAGTLEREPAPAPLDALLALHGWLDEDTARHSWRRMLSACASPADESLLLRLTAATDAGVRAAALRALDRLKSPARVEAARRLGRDTSGTVRLEAAALLAGLGDEECLPVLAGLLAGPASPERDRAAALLRRTTGADPALASGVPPDAPAWLAWIERHRRGAALSPAGAGPAFDALNLANWTCVAMGQAADPRAFWTREDGVLAFRGGTSGVLRTKPAFTDVAVSLEWRWKNAAGGDGGLWLFLGDGNEMMPNGLEVQLLQGAEGDFWTLGNFQARFEGRAAARHVPRAPKAPVKPPGEWNHARIEVVSGRLTVEINGVKCNTATGLPPAGGRIGLQMENSAYEVRDLRIEPVE